MPKRIQPFSSSFSLWHHAQKSVPLVSLRLPSQHGFNTAFRPHLDWSDNRILRFCSSKLDSNWVKMISAQDLFSFYLVTPNKYLQASHVHWTWKKWYQLFQQQGTQLSSLRCNCHTKIELVNTHNFIFCLVQKPVIISAIVIALPTSETSRYTGCMSKTWLDSQQFS